MCEQLTSVIQPVSTADPGQQSCCSDSSFLIIIHSLLEKTHENSLISLEAVWNNLTAWAWFFTSFNKMRLKDLNTERTDWTRGETILNGVLLFPGWGRVPSLLLQDDRWFSFCRFSWKVVTSVCSRLTAAGKHPSSSFSFRLYEVLSFSDFFNQFLSKTKTQTSSRSSPAQTLQEDMRHSTTKNPNHWRNLTGSDSDSCFSFTLKPSFLWTLKQLHTVVCGPMWRVVTLVTRVSGYWSPLEEWLYPLEFGPAGC